MTNNFIALTGSEKQIAWASDLRAKMVENAKEYMDILTTEANALATYGHGKEFRKAIAQIDVMRWEQLENCFCMITPKMYTDDDEVTPNLLQLLFLPSLRRKATQSSTSTIVITSTFNT